MRIARVVALALLLASTGTGAALCDGNCTVVMNFAAGGTLTVSNGATINFGAGGALVLGTGGTLTLGAGGSLDPNVELGLGGTLELGPGGGIQFGAGGSLDTREAGGITLAEAGSLVVAGASGIAVISAVSVHLGDVNAGAAASLTGTTLAGGDTSSPIHLDATGNIAVVSDGDVTYDSVAGGTGVILTETASAAGPGLLCSSDCPAGGTGTIGSPTLPSEPGFPSSANAGAFGLLTLLPLVLAGLGLGPRRRR